MKTKKAWAKAKRVGKKGVAAYAGYQTVASTGELLARRLCHTWHIDTEFEDEFNNAATAFVEEHLVRLPGRTEHARGSVVEDDPEFNSKVWTPLWAPQVAKFVQVKRDGDYLWFRSPLKADITRVRAHIAELADDLRGNQPVLTYEYRSRTSILAWDASKECWEQRKSRTSRTFDSVLVPEHVQAEIVDDLHAFTQSAARLSRLEMPWRRGYLLTGPPGTGKTSMSLAIAASLGFDLASLSLNDIESDGVLRKAVASLGSRTVLVIEDIDAYAISHNRDHNAEKDGKLSLSGLLNSLDGFETPEGLVTIVTTNHVDKLDPALIRSGRLDRTFHLDYIAASELERLFKWFYEVEAPTEAPLNTLAAALAPAEVAEVFKQHLDTPEKGWEGVLALVSERCSGKPMLAVVA